MKVELIDTMGTDLSVVNAARVSFHKESSLENGELKEADIKLLCYLAKHGHWTPFGHTALSFRIKAPIFVARQLGKHQVGLVWNEVSRRYITEEPEFYVPDKLRAKANNVKQGSSSKAVLLDPFAAKRYESHAKESLKLYLTLLDRGVCPEQARTVLPQNMYTEWIWTGNLYAFHNVVNKRAKADTQLETQFIANEIKKHLTDKFPKAYEALYYETY